MKDCNRIHHYQIGLGAIAVGILLALFISRFRKLGTLAALGGLALFLDDYVDFKKCNRGV